MHILYITKFTTCDGKESILIAENQETGIMHYKHAKRYHYKVELLALNLTNISVTKVKPITVNNIEVLAPII